jgi:hypothetical protein
MPIANGRRPCFLVAVVATSIPEMRYKMAKLSTSARKKLPTKAFAEPGKRKYPIENKAHAKNALSRVSQFGTAAEKAKVKRAVKKKYPSIGKNDKRGQKINSK